MNNVKKSAALLAAIEADLDTLTTKYGVTKCHLIEILLIDELRNSMEICKEDGGEEMSVEDAVESCIDCYRDDGDQMDAWFIGAGGWLES